MTLLQLAPRIILDHFGLGISRWNEEVLTKLESNGSSEYRRNPAYVLFSSADGMIMKNMEIVKQATGHDEPTIISPKFGIGADHVKDGKLNEEEISKELIVQINNTNAMKMDANRQNKEQHCKAFIWGLFEVLTPNIVIFLSLYQIALNVIVSNEANFVTKPEQECH